MTGISMQKNKPVATNTPMTKNHIGVVVDKFWEMVPEAHPIFKIDPSRMTNPHQILLHLGQDVVATCEANGHFFENRLKSPAQIDAWKRLLGAWVIYCYQRFRAEGSIPSRCAIAEEMGIAPSSITNFLNARRPVTMQGLKVMCNHMKVNVYDIMADLGASGIHSKERKYLKKMVSIRGMIDEILTDIENDECQLGSDLVNRLVMVREQLALAP